MIAHATRLAKNLRLRLGDEIADVGLTLFVLRVRCSRGDEFLKARIIPKRVEHWIEPEQRWSKRHAHRATVR